jgi:hypothetical protein
MAAAQARVLYEKTQKKVAIVGLPYTVRWHPIWEGLQYITKVSGEPYIRNGPGVRPYIEEKTPERWKWIDWGGPPRGEIVFTKAERKLGSQYAGRIVLEPTIKGNASPAKDWGWVRWNKLAWMLKNKGYRVTQLGPISHPILEGAEHICTTDFRQAAAILAYANGAVLPEGGLHHAAAAVGLRSVVIFGGYISPKVTGYDLHENIFTGEGLGCGSRLKCACCAAAMAGIKPESVADRLIGILNERVRRVAVPGPRATSTAVDVENE